jgi:hypothetical protein
LTIVYEIKGNRYYLLTFIHSFNVFFHLFVCCFNRFGKNGALPPAGLCFTGVGYDPYDLAFFRFMKKSEYLQLNQLDRQQFILDHLMR